MQHIYATHSGARKRPVTSFVFDGSRSRALAARSSSCVRAAAAREYCEYDRMGTQAAVLRELPAAVRVGPSLAASLRIQTVVAAVEEAAKDVRLVVTQTAQTQNTAHYP